MCNFITSHDVNFTRRLFRVNDHINDIIDMYNRSRLI